MDRQAISQWLRLHSQIDETCDFRDQDVPDEHNGSDLSFCTAAIKLVVELSRASCGATSTRGNRNIFGVVQCLITKQL